MNTKTRNAESIINRVAIAVLLLASAAYHVEQGLTAKKTDPVPKPLIDFSQPAVQHAFFPPFHFVFASF